MNNPIYHTCEGARNSKVTVRYLYRKWALERISESIHVEIDYCPFCGKHLESDLVEFDDCGRVEKF